MFNYVTADEATLDWVTVAGADEVGSGERLLLDIGDLSIVVFRIADRLFAIADICSHDDGPLGEGELVGEAIECPRHGARFDLASGKVLSLPAAVDIPAYPVRQQDDQIQIGLPRD